MAGKIKGITIEFNGDATKLNRALREIRSETKTVDGSLRDVNRALKFNPKNTELIIQKQTLLKQKIEATKNQLTQFKNAQEQLDTQGVDKNSQEYMKLRREIITTESKLKNFDKQLKETSKIKLEELGGQFKKVGGAMQSVGTKMSVGAAGLIFAGKQTMDAAAVQVQAEEKLIEIYKTRMGATEEAAQSTMNLASEMQTYGIIGDEVTLSGAQQLATFAKTPETVNKILPAMGDLLAQQKGYNATAQDATNVANLMGKAMMGQTGALKKVGISFSDAQSEVLKYGTEEEKAAMLSEVITQNVGHMNAELAKTDHGKIAQANNNLGDIVEEIGIALAPAVASLMKLVNEHVVPAINNVVTFCQEHPIIAKIIVGVVALMAVLGPILIFIGSLVIAIGALMPIIGAISAPVLIIIGVIAALIAIGVALITHWDQVKATASAVWEGIKNTISGVWDAIKTKIEEVVERVKENFEDLKSAGQFVVDKFVAIKDGIVKAWEYVKSKISSVGDNIKAVFSGIKSALESMKNKFESIKTKIVAPFKWVYDKIKGIAKKLASVFDINFTMPKIKLPHFSISPSGWGVGDLLKGSIPSLGIKWYKHGGVMMKPTAFGMDGSNVMAGGEAGPEAIAPISVLKKYIVEAVRAENQDLLEVLLDILIYLKSTLPNLGGNVVLDTGALVGELAPGIDKKLGNKMNLGRRGI